MRICTNSQSRTWFIPRPGLKLTGLTPSLHILDVSDLAKRYSDQTYIALTLQKLIHLEDNHWNHSDKSALGGLRSLLRRLASPNPRPADQPKVAESPEKFHFDRINGLTRRLSNGSGKFSDEKLRTLQGLRGGSKLEYVKFMEARSVLVREEGLCVSAEEVSIFLLSGKCFFSCPEIY